MKHRIAALAMIFVMCSTVTAGDYVRIGIDSIPAGATNYEIPFFIERTCPDPANIAGISNGFVMEATGDVSWTYVSWYRNPVVSSWFFLGGLLITNHIDGISPDSFLVGGTSFSTEGLPIVDDMHFFSLFLDIGPEGGEILIDSSFFPTSGSWKWSSLGCGLGGDPDRPIFVDKHGSDANHPIHITVYEPMCGDADLSGQVDIDDAVYVISYIFMFGPAPNPLSVADCDCSGGPVPVDIDDVVYLMNYILRGGPEPCDIDGDGVPDC
jgi:hypothetical protein